MNYLRMYVYIPYSGKFLRDKIFDGSKNENLRVKFSRMLDRIMRQNSEDAIFADKIFADVRPTAKSAKILSHENFPLYGINCT